IGRCPASRPTTEPRSATAFSVLARRWCACPAGPAGRPSTWVTLAASARHGGWSSPIPVASECPRILRTARHSSQTGSAAATELGADPAALREQPGVSLLVGQVPGGVTTVAQAYAGHQFGSYVPRLGDGRALLLGEVIDSHGRRRDLHLKGSGRTPFARGGDGKAAVGPMLREYLIGEAMQGLGIATTRALAVVATGERGLRGGALAGGVRPRAA